MKQVAVAIVIGSVIIAGTIGYKSCKIWKYKEKMTPRYTFQVVDHLIDGFPSKEFVRADTITGKTEIMVSMIQKGKRMDFWIPVVAPDNVTFRAEDMVYTRVKNKSDAI